MGQSQKGMMKAVGLGSKTLLSWCAGLMFAGRWPLLLCLFLTSFGSFPALAIENAQAASNPEAVRERLNRIFYWQIADELKLNTKMEHDLATIVEDIQKRRNGALKERQDALDELKANEKTISAKSAEPILKKYQNALAKLAKLDSEEHERLKALLGPELLAKFYLVRESVAEKIRDALKRAEPAPAAPPADKQKN